MHLPRLIWDRINVASVACTIGGFVLFGIGWYYTVNYQLENIKNSVMTQTQRIDALDERGRNRAQQTDGNFKAINETLNDLPYRVQLTEDAIKELRAQQARRDELLADKLDKIITNQARTDTKVEVVSSQVEDLKKSVANKIVWKDSPLFPIPMLREVSLKPCYLPERDGYTAIRAHYRVDRPAMFAGK